MKRPLASRLGLARVALRFELEHRDHRPARVRLTRLDRSDGRLRRTECAKLLVVGTVDGGVKHALGEGLGGTPPLARALGAVSTRAASGRPCVSPTASSRV